MRKNDVIVACDFKDRETTLRFLELFKEEKPFVKIGMELFYNAGPDIVKEIRGRGHDIFLDLKLCDIPNTVQSAMKNLAKLGVQMVNVHAFGGIKMMRAALAGLDEGSDGARPLLIAVTILTSLSDAEMNGELGIAGSVEHTVLRYAENTRAAGLDGVVCSPLEVEAVKAACGGGFLTVTPGIRYASGTDDPSGRGGKDDQTRVTTPARAKEIGSDYIVVGRPITAAEDPVAAYKKAMREFAGV